jgi:hypothetical protein
MRRLAIDKQMKQALVLKAKALRKQPRQPPRLVLELRCNELWMTKPRDGQGCRTVLYKEPQTEMEETDMEGRVTTPCAVGPPGATTARDCR